MTSKSSLKKTAIPKNLWGTRKVRLFLRENSNKKISFSFFLGKLSGVFALEKESMDIYFYVNSCKHLHNILCNTMKLERAKEISKEDLKKTVEPFNIDNLKGQRKKKAIELAKTWHKFETFFSA